MKRRKRVTRLSCKDLSQTETEIEPSKIKNKLKQEKQCLKEETELSVLNENCPTEDQTFGQKPACTRKPKSRGGNSGKGQELDQSQGELDLSQQKPTMEPTKKRKLSLTEKLIDPGQNETDCNDVKRIRGKKKQLVEPVKVEKKIICNGNELSAYFTDSNVERSSEKSKHPAVEVTLSSKIKSLKKFSYAEASSNSNSNLHTIGTSGSSVNATDSATKARNQEDDRHHKTGKGKRVYKPKSDKPSKQCKRKSSAKICENEDNSIDGNMERVEDFTNLKDEQPKFSKDRKRKNTESFQKKEKISKMSVDVKDKGNSKSQNCGTSQPKIEGPHLNHQVKPKKIKKENSEGATLPATVDHSDVKAVLLHMEGQAPSSICMPSTSREPVDDGSELMSDTDSSDGDTGLKAEDSDESEGDWEEVEDHHGSSPKKSQLPDKPVEITLEAPILYKKRKKREFDVHAYFRRLMNKYKKEVLTDMHKVHLMCLLSRCMLLNTICEGDTVRAQIMSIVMGTEAVTLSALLPALKSCRTDHLVGVIQWIKKEFPLVPSGELHTSENSMEVSLEGCIQNGHATSKLEFTLICVIILRQLGFLTRLVMSLQPVPLKNAPSKGGKIKGKSTKKAKVENFRKSEAGKSEPKSKRENKAGKPEQSKIKTEQSKFKAKQSNAKIDRCRSKQTKGQAVAGKVGGSKRPSRRCSGTVRKGAYREEGRKGDSGDDYVPGESQGSSDEESSMDDVLERTSDNSDSDFEDSFKVRTPPLKKTKPMSRNRKVLSSDSDDSHTSPQGTDEWVEVYLEKQQQWICIDCATGQMNKPYELEHSATQPVCYVVGIDQDGHIKDVTARYASQWLTTTRKYRVDQDWWESTLSPYRTAPAHRDEMEDRGIQELLQQTPLPTSISAFKNHPLFALKRHLLKFEALYPDTAVPLGYIRGEPVYARECVHTLHSRENWLKEGRAVRVSTQSVTVTGSLSGTSSGVGFGAPAYPFQDGGRIGALKLGEDAYKFVKSRPKWNKPKDDPEAKDLELFGPWQTEIYIPPPAVDGRVPRNAHGNVEMFLPSMLPAGTVHLKLEGLNKVAKKLDIDCAPAMIGWDNHCGFSHPLMDGWIVCEEFQDILLAAWDEEQEIQREKAAAKREKRVYENWRKLIRGLLIKERLKKRFDLEEKVEVEKSEPVTGKPAEKATDAQHAWPQSRLEGNKHTLCTVETI